MPTVRVEPDGFLIDVDPGETLIEAAWRLGYVWPTTCYGQAECTRCHVEVIAGAEHLSPVGDDEATTLHLLWGRRPNLRLACRVKLDGDVVVRKRGVRGPG